MSGFKDLYIILKAAYGQRNPLRNRYYQRCHVGISQRLASRGVEAYNKVDFASADNLVHLNETEKQLIIASADKTMNNVFNMLGSGDCHLDPVNWSSDFVSGHEWPVGSYYKKYVQVDLQKHFDVKLPRELCRFHFLLHLALAYRFTSDGKYLHKAEELVSDWIEENPLMYSINWGCSMDVGIRAVNWIWGLSLFGIDGFEKAFQNYVAGSLYQHGWFIYHNLEGHQFRYNNNHYLSDLVGLVHIARLYRGDRQADEWYDYALSEFYRETRLQVLPLGMDFEGSTNYHRLVLELILTTIVFLNRTGERVPPDIMSRCESMFDIVEKIMMPDGTMPIVGDQDNGRCLPWGAENLNDYRYLMSLGATIFKREDLKVLGHGYNVYCAIFGEPDSFDSFQHMEEKVIEKHSLLIRDAGFALMRNENDYLLFNVDNQGGYRDEKTTSSHTHSDWFSFVLCADGVPFIIDPGTHVYSSNAESRNLFRSTKMHNTIVVDGQNQSEVYERKLWDLKRFGKVDLLRWNSNEEVDELACRHTGYEYMPHPVQHQRTIVYNKKEQCWLIDDVLTGEGYHSYEAHFHLDEGVEACVQGNRCFLNKNDIKLLLVFSSNQDALLHLVDTSLSKSYGHMVQGKEIIVEFKGLCPTTLHVEIKRIMNNEQN